MKKKRIGLIAAAVLALALVGTHQARLWDVFIEDDELQACDRPMFGRSLVYCLPNATADSLICDYDVGECKRRLWCDCAWKPRATAWYAEDP